MLQEISSSDNVGQLPSSMNRDNVGRPLLPLPIPPKKPFLADRLVHSGHASSPGSGVSAHLVVVEEVAASVAEEQLLSAARLWNG